MTNVFISHKREDGRAISVAKNLHAKLTEFGYEVFIDVVKLASGDLWRDRIYREIHKADVLIVLLQEETAKSDWIQREVDMARGAHVAIIPLQIDAISDVRDAAKRLELTDVQWFTDFDQSDEAYQRLCRDIELNVHGKTGTRAQQTEWFRLRRAEWEAVADDVLSVAAFSLPGFPGDCKIHLSSGDITKLCRIDGKRTFDVIVNSENDHMQMARIFEKNRLSSALRREGSLTKLGRLVEDTVQDELNLQVKKTWGRPIQLRQVIPTHAGHPKSRLVKTTGARFIFHAATVHVDDINQPGTVTPVGRDAIPDVVDNCFEKVYQVDQAKGVIFPKGTSQYTKAAEAEYEPIESIIFPLFGTGHGGIPSSEVIVPLLKAIRNFPRREPIIVQNLKLTDVYVCVYSQFDVEVACAEMEKLFPRI